MSIRKPLAFAVLLATGCSVEGVDDTGADRAGEAISPSTIYELEVKHSGKLLDVAWGSTADGANVHQWARNGTAAQRFRFEPVEGGFYVIRALVSGKVLDVEGRKTSEGANVQQWSYWGGENQQWRLEPAGDGFYYLRARHSGMYLDVAWASKADGANVAQVRHYVGSDAQKWRLLPVSGAPGGGGGPTTRLRITSQCAEPIWIAHSDNVGDPQNIRLTRGQSHDYRIPDGGLASTRFWPKTGCDGAGRNCRIGDSGEGGGKPCPAAGCQPPIDSKFEATFAPRGSSAQTWYNLSQVDGYTLPFKVVPRGKGAESGSCVSSDCSGLSLDRCPGAEDLSGRGRFPAYAHEDLRVRDGAGRVIGCMAPCKRWNYPAPWGRGQPESVDPGLHLCCPTPIDPTSGGCTIDRSCMTSQACSNAAEPLSVVRTAYVAAMRSMCPSAYSYAYDDAAGLHACSSETSFEVVFCP
ncbi:MAG: RICIN domain-containing protein [Deltaproteobacteria bacterium]|nr:RICIN domain-containing protein [Deltaproteobacteria bacterium]